MIARDEAVRRGQRGACAVRAGGCPGCAAIVLLAVGVGGAAGCVAGRSDARGELRALNITQARRKLEVEARVREQDQRSKVGVGRQRSTEKIYEESLGVEIEGSVYHPNFVEFTLAGLFGLTQQDFEERFGDQRATSSDTGDILEFDVQVDFLQKKKYPGSAFASRHRLLQPRPFLSSLETTTSNYGVVWQYVDPKTPTRVQYADTEVELHPLSSSEAPGRQHNSTFRLETGYHFSQQNKLGLIYEHRLIEEQPFGLNYESDELRLSHRIDFGDRHQHTLDSELVKFEQRGTFDIRRTRWRGILRLHHSETLKSWYRYEFLDRTQGTLADVPPIQERSHLISATLEHKLYESLVSQLFAYAQWQRFKSGIAIDRFGVQPSFNYRKKNRWGVLLSDYRFRIQREDRRGGLQETVIIDEPATFTDPAFVVPSNTRIRLNSILITDEAQTVLYREGEDYRVRAVGDRVEIERIPTGRIANEQTVLLDYVYEFGGDFSIDTLTHDFFVRQRFRFGLSPYYRLRYQDQTLSPVGAEGVTPEDVSAQTIGAEWELPELRVSAEYEDHASNITPFTAVRVGADVRHRFKGGGTASLRARWSDVRRYDELSRRTRFLLAEGRYRHPLTEHLTFEGAVMYRTEDDSFSGRDRGVDVDLSVEWLVRETELRITYESGRFEDNFARNENSMLMVQFRRRF